MTLANEGVAGQPHDGALDRRCLQVDVDRAEIEPLSDSFWSGGASGIQELELERGRVRLIVGYESADDERIRAVVAGRHIEVFSAYHHGWLDAWRPFAREFEVGRFCIHPAWTQPGPSSASMTCLAIDAGRSFGQGSHATTRLMLALIDDMARGVEGGMRVLDLGCGSGVLGLAVATLGAHVVALDVEREARRATRHNAARNGLADRVSVRSESLEELVDSGVAPFDLVLANILAPVLIELAPIVGALAPCLVLSGFLDDQEQDVLSVYPDFAIRRSRDLEGWRAVILDQVRTTR